MKPRLVLFGTPEFAEKAFRPLCESGDYEIPLIVTQPDKPSGRGLELTSSPVKELAEHFHIRVVQPESLRGINLASGKLHSPDPRSQELVSELNRSAPIDLFIVVAYGKIIPEPLLQFPRLGALNIHASLLPRWRSTAPIHHALAAGDSETGVGIMQLEAGLDTGPVFSESKTPISEDDDFGTLHDRLASLGSELLSRELPAILSGSLKPRIQAQSGITHAGKWTADDLKIDWQAPPQVILNKIRASAPVPGARSTLNGELIKIFRAALRPGASSAEPGTVVALSSSEITIQLRESFQLLLRELQLAGRKRLSAGEIVSGRAIKQGDRLGT